MSLPALPTIEEIQSRLETVFPLGTQHRNSVVGERAARTVYVMLYIGAIEGSTTVLVPKHMYRMTAEQAELMSEADRLALLAASSKKGFQPAGTRWYSDNTREPIRDETLKDGLVKYNAVVLDEAAVTTANVGRYQLRSSFAALFDPDLQGEALTAAIEDWRKAHLSKAALAKTALILKGAAASKAKVSVTLPNGTVRNMAPGASSIITKAVVELFAPRYLGQPAVLWISESGNKVVEQDNDLAQIVGLSIQADKILPDVILVDLEPAEPMLVFVEVVASDGPVSEARKAALLKLATDGGHDPANVAFITAYQDRDAAAFKKTLGVLAPNTFAWQMSEPDMLLWLKGEPDVKPKRLTELLAEA